jgi:hypothetical protein
LLVATRSLIQAIEALKSNITEQELGWLLPQVASFEAKLRKQIAGMLVTAPSTEPVAEMLEALKADSDAAVRDKAFESLRSRAERTADSLSNSGQ